ncbi:Retrovirus-related Pol polyprotein from transposon 17.6, partial [Mucuna pruriens]
MPFKLKNVEATYQSLMDKILVNILDKNVEAYINDMMMLFDTLNAHNLKLNLDKCSFSILVDNFIGFMLTN